MTAALIITTGRTRYKTEFMPLKQVGGISAVERQILVFKQAGIDRVVLVNRDNAVDRHVSRLNVVCLRNDDPNTQMFDSVKIGIRYLSGKCRRVLVTPVDVPFFDEQSVRSILDSKFRLAALAFHEQAGHPLLVSAKLFNHILSYHGEGGLSGAVKSSGEETRYIEAPDAGVLTDIQRTEEYGHLLETHSMQRLRPEIVVYLSRGKRFFGPDEYFFLLLIDETESVRIASAQMGISYSKAWRTLDAISAGLGAEVVVCRRGGADNGSSQLTEQGAKLVRDYREYMLKAQKINDINFENT